MQSVVNPISSSTSDKIRYIRTIRVRFTSSESFFRTLILRIEADASLGGRYCLPDSSSLHGYKSRDFVTGYYRYARYCLPDKTYYKLQTWSGVLSSRQNLLQTTNMEFSAGWKPVPSVSESNPGRSLGIYNHGENCCLEDSTSHRAKHPRQSDKSVFEKKQGGKTNTDLTNPPDFIRW